MSSLKMQVERISIDEMQSDAPGDVRAPVQSSQKTSRFYLRHPTTVSILADRSNEVPTDHNMIIEYENQFSNSFMEAILSEANESQITKMTNLLSSKQPPENGQPGWLELPEKAIESNDLGLFKLCLTACKKANINPSAFKLRHQCYNLLHFALQSTAVDLEFIVCILGVVSPKGYMEMETEGLPYSFNPLCLFHNPNRSSSERMALTQLLLDQGLPSTIGKHDLRKPPDPLEAYLQSFITNNQFKLQEEPFEDFIDLLCSEISIAKAETHPVVPIASFIESDLHAANDPNITTFQDWTEKALAVSRKLFALVFDVEKKNQDGRSLIHVVTSTLNSSLLKTCLQHQTININNKDKAGLTPLYTLTLMQTETEIEIKGPSLVKYYEILFRHAADANLQARDLTTPIHSAARWLWPEMVQCLARHSDLSICDYLGRTALHFAAKNESHDICSVLLQFKADVNATDVYGNTPLHYACVYENTNAVSALLNGGAQVSLKAKLGIETIHLAGERGNDQIISQLIKAGADVNALDMAHATALHYAGFDGCPETTKALIRHGCDKSLKDCEGLTAFDYAIQRGQRKVALELAEHDVTLKYGPYLSEFPNQSAIPDEDVESHYRKVSQCFAEAGSCSNFITGLNQTPGLCKVDKTNKTNKFVIDMMNKLIFEIARLIGEKDPRFKGIPIPAGSMSEDARVGFPDEFDYMYSLDCLHDQFDIDPAGEAGFSKMKPKNDAELRRFLGDDFFREDGMLSAPFLFVHFRKLMYEALYDIDRSTWPHIQCGDATIEETAAVFYGAPLPQSKLTGFTVTWRSGRYKGLDIPVDMNPVIFVNSWPENARAESILCPSLPEQGVYMIPKSLGEKVKDYEGHPKFKDIGFYAWRISYTHIETSVISSLPEEYKETYAFFKSMRNEPICPAIRKKYCFYDTKTALGPLGEEESSSDDEDELQMLPLNAFMGSGGQPLFPQEDEDINAIGDENEFNSERDEEYSSSGDDESMEDQPDTVEMDYEECQKGGFMADLDPDPLTCEHLIPTYYLKQIFLHTLDEEFMSGKKADNRSTEERQFDMLFKLYTKLDEALETETLSAYFFPSQNVLSNPKEDIGIDQLLRLRKMFCQGIISILRNVKALDADGADG